MIKTCCISVIILVYFYIVMYNLIVTGNHAAHISLAAKMLKVNHILVAEASVWDESWQDAYDRTIRILADWAYEYMDVCLWKWYIETQIIYEEPRPELPDLYVESGETLEESVFALARCLPYPHIENWLENSASNRAAIRFTWELILGRTPVGEEIEYWNEWTGREHEKRIDLFSWLLFLHFSLEGKRTGLHLEYVRLFKKAKYDLPITYPLIALIMSGHTKDYPKNLTSHKLFIDNIYIDIFMHVWRKKGPRTYTGETGTRFIDEEVDIEKLRNDYGAMDITVEDLEIYRPEFSMIDDMNLLFFHMGQQKDDASFYENADLYSLYKASLSVENHEREHGFTYAGMIKMSFIMKLDRFDFKGICEGLKRDIFWVPEGGCRLCNREFNWPLLYEEKGHEKHVNDINVYWMYGKRDIMAFACRLYLHAYAFAENVLEENMKNYLHAAKYKKFRNFVYIYDWSYIEKKVYDINDICMKVQGFYKQNLYREYMKDYFCVTTGYIRGSFAKFDLDRNAIGT